MLLLITAPFSCRAAVLWKSRSALMSPACTVYLNTRVLLSEPLTYIASRSISPVSSRRVGLPLLRSTLTTWSQVMLTSTSSPIFTLRSRPCAATLTTFGFTGITLIEMVSTSDLAPPEPELPLSLVSMVMLAAPM